MDIEIPIINNNNNIIIIIIIEIPSPMKFFGRVPIWLYVIHGPAKVEYPLALQPPTLNS
jgi:hypothetical protein